MNSTEGYLQPSATVRTEITIQKSRFIATTGLATSVEDARSFISNIRDEMPDASHHVYAFIVGYGTQVIEGMSDDGEPSGTSGPPVLAILRGSEIGDIVLVVTRYFGGTKLGTGGLVRAYSEAARTALSELPTHQKIAKSNLLLEISYSQYTVIKRVLTEYDGEIISEDFAASIVLQIEMPTEKTDGFRKFVLDQTAGQSEPIEV